MFFVTVCQAVCCHAIMTYTADNSAKSLNTSGDPRPVTLYITTIDGEEPTFDIVYPPEGGTGVGICNRTKVMGRMVMTTGTDTLYDSGEWAEGTSGMSIKVRGNTSAASAKEQLPYKIKLVKKADLLMRGSKVHKHKDWVLLRGTWKSVQNSLHTQVEETLQHLATRVATVDSLMAYYTWWLKGVGDCPTSTPATSRAIYNTTGQKVTTTTPLHQLPAGGYTEVGSDGRARKVIKK